MAAGRLPALNLWPASRPGLLTYAAQLVSTEAQGGTLFRVRSFLNLIFAGGLLLTACQSAPTAAPKAPVAAKASPVAGERTGAAATPALPVASPIVQLVQGGKVAPGQGAVHVFLWGHPETTDRDLKLAKEAGFTWVKQRFEWRNIEKTKKDDFEWNEPDRIVDAVNKAGLGIIARLDNQPDWARRDKIFPKQRAAGQDRGLEGLRPGVRRAVQGQDPDYEIWNEPNIAREWGDNKPGPESVHRDAEGLLHRDQEDATRTPW